MKKARVFSIYFKKITFMILFFLISIPAYTKDFRNFDFFGCTIKNFSKDRYKARLEFQHCLENKLSANLEVNGKIFMSWSHNSEKHMFIYKNSETEGYDFTIQYNSWAPYGPPEVEEKVLQLSEKDFFPISKSFPSIQLMKSKPQDLVNLLGKAKNNKTIYQWYFYKDVLKTRDCRNNEKITSLDYYGIILRAEFDEKQRLKALSISDSISGEC